jgi:hypothetical protein
MLCPSCKASLVVTGRERLETLVEHVSDPNGTPSMKDKYECSDLSCPTRGFYFWNSYGETYTSAELYRVKPMVPFIDGNEGPFGSLERRLNIEVYKKDENHPLFGIETRWGMIRVEYEYTANEDGGILSRRRTYRIWKKEGDHYTSHIPGVDMFLYVLSDFRKKLRRGRLEKDDLYPQRWDTRWWSRLGHGCIRAYMKVFRHKQWKELTA